MSDGALLSRPVSRARAPHAGWLVSPAWDLTFLIASPLLIVPSLWLLVHEVVTPEQLAIPVFAFATLGHHLPGYMRAYGDRDLFARFRTRFVLVPPLLFGAALFLVQPAWFGLDVPPPVSLQLLLVLWGAWHGLMQIYGFMRIYDARQGAGHGRAQRLDLAVCFGIFVAGFLFSDPRMFALLDLAWRAGLPTFSPPILAGARVGAGALLALLAAAYLANLYVERRRGRRMGEVKLLLAASTFGIYTWSGLVTTNVLLGAAVFEVFHAGQYLAIVWYFNRRLEDRVGDAFGPLRFLFRKRRSSLALYLGSIAVFGSSFLAMGTPRYGPLLASGAATDTLYVLFSAFFVTSSLLHYYYDGFIWKLHDRRTGSTLGATGPSLREVSVPGLLHAARWGALVLVVVGLVSLEISRPATAERRLTRLQALARLTPEVPELRSQLLQQDLAEGRTAKALASAEADLALRPRDHAAWADLGRVRIALEDWPAAEAAYRRAVSLLPGEAVYRLDLARVIAHQGRTRLDDAARAYREALAARPGDAITEVELADVELERGDASAATSLLQAALATTPDSLVVRRRLVSSLVAVGDVPKAVDVAREGATRAPASAAAQELLGEALVASSRPRLAEDRFVRARELDPTLPAVDYEIGRLRFAAGRYREAENDLLHASEQKATPAKVYFMLGTVYAKTGRREQARTAWQRFVAAAPDPATGERTLGGLLARAGELEGAEAAYLESLRLQPGHAPTRRHLERVERLLWQRDHGGVNAPAPGPQASR